MELEEMQALWTSLSQRIEKLEIINNQKIMEITQIKYKNKFNTITKYESIGAAFCYLIAIFILLNFHKLDTWYLSICGVISLAFLTIMPYFSLGYLRKLSNIDLTNSTYKKIIQQYQDVRKKTIEFQKWAVVTSIFMMFITIPVADKLLNEEDFFAKEFDTQMWFVIGIGCVFVVYVAQWGLGWYKKITNSAEQMLFELDHD